MKPGIDYIPVREPIWTLFVRMCPMKLAPRLLSCKAFLTAKELVISGAAEFSTPERNKIREALALNDSELDLKIVPRKRA